MKRILLFTLLVLLLPLPARAQSPLTAEENRAEIAFPNQITFNVSLTSGAEIDAVVLEYGVAQINCGEVIAKAFPTFEPANAVQTSWTWEMLQSGSLPPGAQIWWRWRASDANGNELVTETQTITWLDDVNDWQTIAEDGIALHWYAGGDAFGEELHAAAVEALLRLSRETGIEADGVVHLYIYASTDDLRQAVLYEPGWTGGQAFAEHNIVIIGIAPNDIEWGIDTEAHELTHVLVGHQTFSCLGFVPSWLHEGLAMYGEGGLDDASLQAFDKAVAENTVYSVRALSGGFSENPDRADISYSQSYSLVNYLIETHGKDALNSLLLALRDGASVDDALEQVYGFDVDGLEDAWRAAIGAAPRAIEPTAAETPIPTAVPTIVPVSSAPQGPAIEPTRERPGLPAAEPVEESQAAGQAASQAQSSGLILLAAAIGLGAVVLLGIVILAARRK